MWVPSFRRQWFTMSGGIWVGVHITHVWKINNQSIQENTHFFMLFCCCVWPNLVLLSADTQYHAWEGVSEIVYVKSSWIFLTRSLDFSSRVCGSRSSHVISSSLWRSASTAQSRHKTEHWTWRNATTVLIFILAVGSTCLRNGPKIFRNLSFSLLLIYELNSFEIQSSSTEIGEQLEMCGRYNSSWLITVSLVSGSRYADVVGLLPDSKNQTT